MVHVIPTRRLAALVSVAAMLVALATASTAAAANCPDQDLQPSKAAISLPRIEASVHCLLNRERASRGLRALAPNGPLAVAARGHSTSMRSHSFFSHNSLDGSPFQARIFAAGYLHGAKQWIVGENLAWGSHSLGTARALVKAWMNSPGHRANILQGKYREIGIGAAWGSPVDPNMSPAVIVSTDFGFKSTKRKKKGRKLRRLKRQLKRCRAKRRTSARKRCKKRTIRRIRALKKPRRGR